MTTNYNDIKQLGNCVPPIDVKFDCTQYLYIWVQTGCTGAIPYHNSRETEEVETFKICNIFTQGQNKKEQSQKTLKTEVSMNQNP